LAGDVDGIGDIAQAAGIVGFPRQAVGDHYHYQVTAGLNETNRAESTPVTIGG